MWEENGETASLLEDTVRVTLTIKIISPTTDKVAEKEPRMLNCAWAGERDVTKFLQLWQYML